jgi:hypothetical protein
MRTAPRSGLAPIAPLADQIATNLVADLGM